MKKKKKKKKKMFRKILGYKKINKSIFAIFVL